MEKYSQTNEMWELKEKRDVASRVYNSVRINNKDITVQSAMAEAERVVTWLFATYKTEVKTASPYQPSLSGARRQSYKKFEDMDDKEFIEATEKLLKKDPSKTGWVEGLYMARGLAVDVKYHGEGNPQEPEENTREHFVVENAGGK